jgi:predicted nuclease with TOPRIM domain
MCINREIQKEIERLEQKIEEAMYEINGLYCEKGETLGKFNVIRNRIDNLRFHIQILERVKNVI